MRRVTRLKPVLRTPPECRINGRAGEARPTDTRETRLAIVGSHRATVVGEDASAAPHGGELDTWLRRQMARQN